MPERLNGHDWKSCDGATPRPRVRIPLSPLTSVPRLSADDLLAPWFDRLHEELPGLELLDENAASHIAFGQGFPFVIGDESRDRVNQSEIHLDFMIGSEELRVTGVTADGERVLVLAEGHWGI